MSDARATQSSAVRIRRIVAGCGVVVALSGLAQYEMADDSLVRFLSSAMVVVGVLIAIPQLVALAISSTADR